MTRPFDLEVHRPVQLEDGPSGLPVLPLYEKREHDQVLGQVVRAAADGRSGIAVLVGGSSTGKTRACWEALNLLRDQDPPWRLWHPIDPSPPDAALRELPDIGPRTVVWLNEAERYLVTADERDERGERVAAGLRGLLRNAGRGPVLVLATVWPQYWAPLTARPASGTDRHTQARELLAGHDITVPGKFTPTQLSQLAQAADLRLALAARSAPDGEVIQFLAGAPELLARYRNAPPAARALIQAAMDARRLGMGVGLPQAFLKDAAPGYLTDAEWNALGENWLEQALSYTDKDAKGVRGPLTRIHPRPTRRAARGHGDQPASTAAAAGPLYRLADYLDQDGRAHRARETPPTEFWAAAADHAAPADQAALGDAAHDRGLYRAAVQLHKNAAASGDFGAADYLGHPPRGAAGNFPGYLRQPPSCLLGDARPAAWAVAHVSLDNPRAVAILLDTLREARAQDQVTALLARDPAAHVSLDNHDVAQLLRSLRKARAYDQVTALLARDPAAHAILDNALAVNSLLDNLQRAGAQDQVTALASRAAAHVSLDDPVALDLLLFRLRQVGTQDQVTALASRAAAHVPLDNPHGVASLLDTLQDAGAQDQATELASRAAAHATLDDPDDVAVLLGTLWMRGAQDQVTALLARDPATHAILDNPHGVSWLLDNLRLAGAQDQVTALASRAATHVPLDNPDAVARLLGSLRKADAQHQATELASRAAAHAISDSPDAVAALLGSLRSEGAQDQATELASRAATHVSLDDPGGVAALLDSLREAGAHDQVTALLTRDPATHAILDDPDSVASLLDSLRDAGTQDQVTALLARDPAAHAILDDPGGVAALLDSLRRAGAHDQVTALLTRDPAAHAILDDPGGVARLLNELVAPVLDNLRGAGAQDQATELASRAAAYVSLDDPDAVAYLLGSLRRAGAQDQETALASRAAAHVSLDDENAVSRLLLYSLLATGKQDQAKELADRLPAVGMFGLFLLYQRGRQDQFPFGREADGSPSAPWGWEDLDLWLVP